MSRSLAAANVVILILLGIIALLYFDKLRTSLMPPTYDDAYSFRRIDVTLGWVDTGLVIKKSQPIGILTSGVISTDWVSHDAKRDVRPNFYIYPDGLAMREDLVPGCRIEPDFPPYALLGRVAGGKPFFIGHYREIAIPGKFEVLINILFWGKRNDQTCKHPPRLETREVYSSMYDKYFTTDWNGAILWDNVEEDISSSLNRTYGFFAYRIWNLIDEIPLYPFLPPTAGELEKLYGSHPRYNTRLEVVRAKDEEEERERRRKAAEEAEK